MALRKRRRLQDAYRFPGFQPLATVRGVFGDPQVRIVQLVFRRKKRRVASAGKPMGRSTVSGPGGGRFGVRRSAIWREAISDLDRMRPMWFGGTDRSAAIMDEFFAWLGPKRSVGAFSRR